MDELISIITPSYNTAPYILQTIQSVLNQTYTYWEMIIVDDCSTDNTCDVVNKFSDERIIYIQNERNSGAAISRNKALAVAKGKWIAFLDSDDLWAPDKLEKQLEFMKDNKYHFSYTNYSEIGEESESLGVFVTGPKKISKAGMYNYCWPGCLTVMYDADVVGLVQIADLKKNNDYAIWLQVIRITNCYLLDKELAKYRRRTGSISNHGYIKLVKWHYMLYRIGEKRSRIISSILTVKNMIFGFWKKVKYVHKCGEQK